MKKKGKNMIDIRLTGTNEEIEKTIEKLKEFMNIDSVSGFYPNRGSKTIGRVYIKVFD